MNQADFERPVRLAETRYLQSLYDDMVSKEEKWKNCKDYKKSQYLKEYKSARLAYWVEAERLSFGDDHEEVLYYRATTLALSKLDTQEIRPEDNPFNDPDRDDDDWKYA